jgi:hypothetical protein
MIAEDYERLAEGLIKSVNEAAGELATEGFVDSFPRYRNLAKRCRIEVCELDCFCRIGNDAYSFAERQSGEWHYSVKESQYVVNGECVLSDLSTGLLRCSEGKRRRACAPDSEGEGVDSAFKALACGCGLFFAGV